MTFSLEKAILWIEDVYFSRSNGFKCLMIYLFSYKHAAFSLCKTFNVWTGVVWTTCRFYLWTTCGLVITCGLLVDLWLLVDYLWTTDVFISCLNSHSDGTHSLQRIHWRASEIMLKFSKTVLRNKQAHLHLACPEYIFSNLGELFLSVEI